MADQFYSARKHNYPEIKENLHIYLSDAITKESDTKSLCNYPHINFADTEEYIKGTDYIDIIEKLKGNKSVCKQCELKFKMLLSKPQ